MTHTDMPTVSSKTTQMIREKARRLALDYFGSNSHAEEIDELCALADWLDANRVDYLNPNR
jgi:hypothetical protein